jgi:hypothetical protein
MRIFYDCEFLEDGKTIDLISIGLIAEAGDEYYAVNLDMPIERIESHGWLMKNVVPHIPGQLQERSFDDNRNLNGRFSLDPTDAIVKPHWVIANKVRDRQPIADDRLSGRGLLQPPLRCRRRLRCFRAVDGAHRCPGCRSPPAPLLRRLRRRHALPLHLDLHTSDSIFTELSAAVCTTAVDSVTSNDASNGHRTDTARVDHASPSSRAHRRLSRSSRLHPERGDSASMRSARRCGQRPERAFMRPARGGVITISLLARRPG